ncbi:YIP1 family protein [Rhodobacter sp. Har01]|uniref:YIP1 family protein n=1 Tax=Rhodobacter sp. Har01 TaxID=2883999 RepID=UPI001D08041B|nr:YIP1 family protein [Rhodobacter sp. Har01]MCB6177143.1 YIP1 family protein [Rhodobacter sp. Har01]
MATRMAETLRDPRAGLRGVLRMDLPRGARWAALTLTAVASALLVFVAQAISPPMEGLASLFFASPFRAAAVELAMLAISALLVHTVGRAWGGTGSPDDAVLLVAWLQAIMLAIQLLQIVLLLAVPPLALPLGLLSIGLFFWLASNFIAELHGFSSTLRVFGAILLVMFGLVVVISLILSAVFGPEVLNHV